MRAAAAAPYYARIEGVPSRTEAVHWVAGDPPAAAFEATAKTRYRQPDQACRVRVDADGRLSVTFAAAQRAVTPGQSLVLYRDEACLGGAVVATTDSPLERRLARR